MSLPRGTSRGFAICDARDGAVVGEIVHFDDGSARVRIGGRNHYMVSAQAHRYVKRSGVEDRYLAIVTAHAGRGERRSEIRDAVVRSGDEINRVLAAGAHIIEGVASAGIRSDGVEWSGAVRSHAVQDDPRSRSRGPCARHRDARFVRKPVVVPMGERPAGAAGPPAYILNFPKSSGRRFSRYSFNWSADISLRRLGQGFRKGLPFLEQKRGEETFLGEDRRFESERTSCKPRSRSRRG